MSDLFKAERDCLAGLGLLASTYLRFDPQLKSGTSFSHAHGFNVHCLVIDNVDGEALALERNRIHADDNPLQHAEQVGIRAALDRLHEKRPRADGISVEKHYKNFLFMGSGTNTEDFMNKGCTLYNTFDPCGMCAVSLLVAYMKRIAYLFEDEKFSAVYDSMRTYFKNRESVKEPLALLEGTGDNPLIAGSTLIRALRTKVTDLEHKEKVPLVETLDHCRDELRQATELLTQTTAASLQTTCDELTRNTRTLSGIKRLCNIN